jgi:hypothetical protein
MRRNEAELSPLSEVRPSMRWIPPETNDEALRGLVFQLSSPRP